MLRQTDRDIAARLKTMGLLGERIRPAAISPLCRLGLLLVAVLTIFLLFVYFVLIPLTGWGGYWLTSTYGVRSGAASGLPAPLVYAFVRDLASNLGAPGCSHGTRKRMKTIVRRLRRLEESFGPPVETEFSRRLRERIEVGRRRVAEARESGLLSPPPPDDDPRREFWLSDSFKQQ